MPCVRSLLCAFLFAFVLGACKDLALGENVPGVTGVWTGALDSASVITLVLAQDEDENVSGSGFVGSGSDGLALEVLSGIHVFPSVSLLLRSDFGHFSLVGNRSPSVTPLRYGLTAVTITGEFNGPGYSRHALVLTRQDSVTVPAP